MTRDAIAIRGLRVKTRIGVTEAERVAPQAVIVDIEIFTALEKAGRSDDLADTVDYGGIAAEAARVVEESECRLLEHLAEKICSVVLAHRRVDRVDVAVAKETPPVPQEVRSIVVRISRQGR